MKTIDRDKKLIFKDNKTKSVKSPTKSKLKKDNNIEKNDSSNEFVDLKVDLFNTSKIINDLGSIEKCTGCFDRDASIFCIQCEKLFCKTCEDLMHIIPSFKGHSRILASKMYKLKKLCFHHGIKLNLYCESCEEAICQECLSLGPHFTRLHKILTINDAFQKKFSYLRIFVESNLKELFKNLLLQAQFLEYNIKDIKRNKGKLERDLRRDFYFLLDKLYIEERKKIAVLQYDNSNLQKEINQIHDAINYIKENSINEHPEMIEFLIKYKENKSYLEIIVSKNIKGNYELNILEFAFIQPNIFSDFYKERKRKLTKYDKAREVLKLKDDIIWSLLLEKKKKEQCQLSLIKERARKEISEWAKYITYKF